MVSLMTIQDPPLSLFSDLRELGVSALLGRCVYIICIDAMHLLQYGVKPAPSNMYPSQPVDAAATAQSITHSKTFQLSIERPTVTRWQLSLELNKAATCNNWRSWSWTVRIEVAELR
jgi:hypothetical protein